MDVTVSLNDAFQVETMELKVAKRDVETVVVGTIEEQPESKEIAELKKKIAAYYQMDTDRISILD